MASIEHLTARLRGELAKLTALKAALVALMSPLDDIGQGVDALLHNSARHETIIGQLAHAHQIAIELHQMLTKRPKT